MLTTTFKRLRKHNVCKGGYPALRKSLGRGYRDDTPITIIQILDTNGVADAIWALRACDGHEALARKFACRCVRETAMRNGHTVWELLVDKRSRDAVIIAERYADGLATDIELRDARISAREASFGLAYFKAEYEAARSALFSAKSSAGESARDASRAAVWAVAVAGLSAGMAARAHQEKIFREMFGESV